MEFMKDENGQGMVEYGLVIGLIALLVEGTLIIFGPKIKTFFDSLSDKMNTTTPAT